MNHLKTTQVDNLDLSCNKPNNSSMAGINVPLQPCGGKACSNRERLA